MATPGTPTPRPRYSHTAPSTPARRHSQRYHHVMPSSCAGGAGAAAPAAPEPLMLPGSYALGSAQPQARTKGRVHPRAALWERRRLA